MEPNSRLGQRIGRDQMLTRAARLFAEKGYDAASIRDIAEEAEVRPSSLYHHFPGKEGILFEICYSFQRDFNLEVTPELRADRPPEEAVRATIRRHVLFSYERWSELLVGMRERRSLPPDQQTAIAAMRRQYRDAIASTIERGRRQGVFAVPDPKLAAMTVLDMAYGCAIWFRPRDRRDLERMAARYADAAVALLRGWEEKPARAAAGRTSDRQKP